MIEFGKTLREAREAKGYTVGQVAETTHMLSAVVEGLEREDFSHVPAPIYGRGFVKLYCEAVGIDPKPMVAAFMELYNGNRPSDPVRRTVPRHKEIPVAAPAPAPVAAPVTEPATEPVAAPEPVPTAPLSVPPSHSEPEPIPAPPVTPPVQPPAPPEPLTNPAFRMPQPEAAPVPRPVVQQRQPDLFGVPDEPQTPPQQARPQPIPVPAVEEPASHVQPTLSRYSAPVNPKPEFHLPTVDIPPAVWRVGALVLGAIAILVLLLFGVRALYRATTEPVETVPTAEETIERTAPGAGQGQPSESAPNAVPQAPREPQQIPPLYID